MRAVYGFTLAIIIASASIDTHAGSSGSSSSGGGRASSPSPSRGATSSSPNSRPAYTARPAGRIGLGPAPSQRRPFAANRVGQSQSVAKRRSLLGAGPQPSPRITQVIRERERSGPGWLGTAFLVALLSQHDLSSSDRSWIQSRIDALKGEEEDGESERNALLPPALTSMSITGVSQTLRAGQAASFNVTGKSVDNLACEIEGSNAQLPVSRQAGAATLSWTPAQAGAFILNCRAGTRTERRVLRVASK